MDQKANNSTDESSDEHPDAQCECQTDRYHKYVSKGYDGESFSVKKCLQCGTEGRVLVTDDGREWFGELYANGGNGR